MADSSTPVRTDLDEELDGSHHSCSLCSLCDTDLITQDAQWFSREQVLAVLRHPNGTRLHRQSTTAQDNKNNPQGQSGGSVTATSGIANGANPGEINEVTGKEEPQFRLPPSATIAGTLVKDWAEGRIGNVSRRNRG
jgi:NAD+ diphosphatase